MVGVEWEEREGMIGSENLITSNNINVKMYESLNRRRRLRFKHGYKFIWRDTAK
jgi:hypothetical protein